MFEMEGNLSGSERRKAAFVPREVVGDALTLGRAVIHPSFPLLALNVGCLLENEWRTDKEPSTMAAGAKLTRTAVG